MKLDTKTKLTLLLQHYQQTRGAGHTQALFDGLKPGISLDGTDRRRSNAVVMASDLNTAGRLFPFLYPKQWTSWNTFEEREAYRLRSRQYPLVLDNSAIIAILQDALDWIAALEHQIKQLREGKPEFEPPQLYTPTKTEIEVAMMLAKVEMYQAEAEDREKLERLARESDEEE